MPTYPRVGNGCPHTTEVTVITEHSRFQLEAGKLGRDVMFQVTVFEKEERKRKKLFAETQCSDPFHMVIQFIIREVPDFPTLLQRFVKQLEHRGFAPTRMRMRLVGADGSSGASGKWDAWTPVPYLSGSALPPAADPPAMPTAEDKAVRPARARS